MIRPHHFHDEGEFAGRCCRCGKEPWEAAPEGCEGIAFPDMPPGLQALLETLGNTSSVPGNILSLSEVVKVAKDIALLSTYTALTQAAIKVWIADSFSMSMNSAAVAAWAMFKAIEDADPEKRS